jgi:hypothetical protein
MTVEAIREFLLWCSVINVGLLLLSFAMLVLLRPFVFKMHSGWSGLNEQQFNTAVYGLLGLYKILIIVFNVVPLIAIYITMQS